MRSRGAWPRAKGKQTRTRSMSLLDIEALMTDAAIGLAEPATVN